jgi:Sensors of blue-light using FAD
MISLVYASSAVKLMTNNELDELLEKSRKNNKRLDITGMLLYKDGNFMQALEGPDENILALYAKIERDARHTGSIKLLQKQIQKREFGEWEMAFCDFNRITEDSSDGFSSFLCEPLDSKAFRDNPTSAHKLLLSFRKNIR